MDINCMLRIYFQKYNDEDEQLVHDKLYKI